LIEELGAREKEFAVEFENLVELGGYVAANNVFDAYPCGLKLANLAEVLAEYRSEQARQCAGA
jgi:hypothetical protein